MGFFFLRSSVSSGGGDSSGFRSDPYSARTTVVVDPSVSADTPGGDSGTVTWKGESVSLPRYKTVGYAMANAGANVRIGLLNSTDYGTMPADLYFGASGMVLMKDPTASEAQMPRIGLGTNSGNSKRIAPNLNNNANDCVIWGINIEGQVELASSPGQIFLDSGSNQCRNLLIQYCKLHGYRQSSGGNNGGSVVCHNSQDNGFDTTKVKFCKIYNNTLTAGGYNDNICGVIGDAVDSVEVENCDFSDMGQAVFNKFPGSSTGWKVRKTKITVVNRAFRVNGGAGGASTGHEFTGCFVDELQTGAYAVDCRDLNQCGSILFDHCTFGPDCAGGIALERYSAATVRNSALLTNGAGAQYKLSFETATMTLSTCNYNAHYDDFNYRANGTTYSSFNNWKAASGAMITSPDANSHSLANLTDHFVDPNNGDFTVKVTSALHNAASDGTDIGPDWDDLGPGDWT